MPSLDSFLSLIPFRVYDTEASHLSSLIDTHFNLLPHSSIDSHLATAVSVLAKNSEAVRHAAEQEGVLSMASKKWLPHSEQLKTVDTLKPFPSLKMPPEQEQAMLRHTLSATLQHKIDLAKLDLRRVLSVTNVLESPSSADESIQKTLDLRFAPEPKLALLFDKDNYVNSSILEEDSSKPSNFMPDIENELQRGPNADLQSAFGHLSKEANSNLLADIVKRDDGNENLFIWKATTHDQPTNKSAEPYLVVHNDENKLQLLPMRSALAYADNREVFYRDSITGKISTPDMKMFVQVGDDGVVRLEADTGLDTSRSEWKLQDDRIGVFFLSIVREFKGYSFFFPKKKPSVDSTKIPFSDTLVAENGERKEFLQFPGIVDSFVDTRHLEPAGVFSNVMDRPEHPAEFAIDGTLLVIYI